MKQRGKSLSTHLPRFSKLINYKTSCH